MTLCFSPNLVEEPLDGSGEGQHESGCYSQAFRRNQSRAKPGVRTSVFAAKAGKTTSAIGHRVEVNVVERQAHPARRIAHQSRRTVETGDRLVRREFPLVRLT
jgi:hypothetical protein